MIEAKTITDDLTARFKEAGIDFSLKPFTPTASAVMLPMPVAVLSIENRNAERKQKLLSRQRIQFCKTDTGVTLDSDYHLLLEGEPAAQQFLDAVKAFLAK